ncbi:uncharacterized protein LOC128965138 [Oppia nitens]|uniref:uncharacterized protein LOC128965138 n=1 Tax=Oppia nitens TaxID=1686743 RepID=UPI0023D9EA16|nr:uncharacterized protein LOC128965138 [Oppia nitens]
MTNKFNLISNSLLLLQLIKLSILFIILLLLINPGRYCNEDYNRYEAEKVHTDEEFKQMDDAYNKLNIEKYGKGDCPGSRHKCPLGPWCCDDYGYARNCPQQACRGICCQENDKCLRKALNAYWSEIDKQNDGYYCKNDGQNDGNADNFQWDFKPNGGQENEGLFNFNIGK